MIGVRNNDGRAEDAAEIDVGRTFLRKKAQGWLPRPLMAGAGLGGKYFLAPDPPDGGGGKRIALGADSQQAKNACFLGDGGAPESSGPCAR